jgi:hypothetical protein
MVVQVAQRATLWARPLNPNGMIQENVNLSLFQFQFHAFDIPRIGYPDNLSIKLSVLNGCSPLGASPVQLHSAWAEDRAMLGSNPSADSGPKTEAGCLNHTPFRILIALGIGTKAINPGGLGAGPQHIYPLRTRNSPFFTDSRSWSIHLSGAETLPRGHRNDESASDPPWRSFPTGPWHRN